MSKGYALGMSLAMMQSASKIVFIIKTIRLHEIGRSEIKASRGYAVEQISKSNTKG